MYVLYMLLNVDIDSDYILLLFQGWLFWVLAIPFLPFRFASSIVRDLLGFVGIVPSLQLKRLVNFSEEDVHCAHYVAMLIWKLCLKLVRS